MSFKIVNIKLANAETATASEVLKFDKDGVAEVESEDLYNSLLEIGNFHEYKEGHSITNPVLETEKPEKNEESVSENSPKNDKDEQEESEPKNEKEEPVIVREAKESMSHDELDEIADEYGLRDDEDYPQEEVKAVKTAYINSAIAYKKKEEDSKKEEKEDTEDTE